MSTTSSQNPHEGYMAKFCHRLLKTILSLESKDNNIAVSPARLQATMVLLANYAEPGVSKRILELIGDDTLTLEEANALSSIKQMQLEPSERFKERGEDILPTIEQQTLLWAQNELEIQQEALEKVVDDFALMIKKVDFKDKGLKAVIDSTIAQATHGQIKELEAKLTQDTSAVIMDILYFKAVWKRTFEKYNTRNIPFHGTKGILEVPMMYQEAKFDYAETASCQAVKLPYICYAKGHQSFSMRIYLPKPKYSVRDVLDEIDHIKFSFLGNSPEVKLSLPRFRVESNLPLTEIIRQIGLGFILDSDDIIPLCIKALKIQQILQQAKVTVDETGTEASAVTTVLTECTAMPPTEEPKPIVMVVDRPFVFEILENWTDTVLFSGIINNVD